MRPQSTDVDAMIIDVAAGLFAVHGFERTSVQQVADAVGYSKTGLLHRFPTKRALADAVRSELDTIIAAVVEFAATSTLTNDELLRRIADEAVSRPGLVNYLLSVIGGTGSLESAEVHAEALVERLAGPNADPVLRLRVMLALHCVCVGVTIGAADEYLPLKPDLSAVLARIAGDIVSGGETRHG